jgi:ribosomal-protein-alanine N-acetyltransferase
MATRPKDIPQQTAKLSIRTMTYGDLSHVMEVEELAYRYPWTVGIFRDCIRVGYNCWVAILQERIIGYGIVMLAAGEAHVLNLCVSPEFQSRGIGRKLLQHLTRRAQLADIDMILLEVRRSNQAAIELYHSEGFHELGVRKNYYPGDQGREDAIILARYLPGAEDETKQT